MNSPDADSDDLLRRAAAGETAAMDAILERHRDRLGRMVRVRMDPRLRTRVDPSDVVQETLAAASDRLPQYLTEQPIAFYPWLRQIAREKLGHLLDRHLRAARRSVTREEVFRLAMADHSSEVLADHLVSNLTSPSGAAVRQEVKARFHEALGSLSQTDQEILVQRHMEQLSSREIAENLGVSENAVNKRHVRALIRLRKLLSHDHEQD